MQIQNLHPNIIPKESYIILGIYPTIKGLSTYVDKETGAIIDPINKINMPYITPLVIKASGMYYIFKKSQKYAMIIQPTLRYIEYLDIIGVSYAYIHKQIDYIIIDEHKKQCTNNYITYIHDILLAYDV